MSPLQSFIETCNRVKYDIDILINIINSIDTFLDYINITKSKCFDSYMCYKMELLELRGEIDKMYIDLTNRANGFNEAQHKNYGYKYSPPR